MRDLDELLDPVVSRHASAAARTPDFAAVERRGRQRRRRARAAAVGAVVAVAAVVSVVGAQVASYRSDTAPAGTIQWDGPNGELAHAVESGNADNQNVAVTGDGSMLSTWSHLTRKIRPDFGASVKGFSLTTRGHTFWSPLDYASVDDVYPLGSGAFVIGVLEKRSAPISYFVADPTGIRPLEATEEPADVAGSSYEGYVWMIDPSFRRWGIYAVDVESATAAPVSQLSGISADSNDAYQLPQTEDGELWVVDGGPNGRSGLVHMASDGRLSTYPLPDGLREGAPIRIGSMSLTADGRPILVWMDGRIDVHGELHPPANLMVTTVTEAGTVRTVDLGVAAPPRAAFSAGQLADGRLLIQAGDTLLRTTDGSWQHVERVDLTGVAARREMGALSIRSIAETVCLVPTSTLDGSSTPSEINCTDDGETWSPVDLTP